MRAAWLIVPSLLLLGACGDPLADIDRVTDDTFAPDTTRATALPTQAELEREGSILSGLFRKRADVQAAPTDIADPSDAQASSEALDVPAPELAQDASPATDTDSIDAALQTALASPPETGTRGVRVLGWLRRGGAANDAPDSAPIETATAKATQSEATHGDTPVVPADTEAEQIRVADSDADAILPDEDVYAAALPEVLSTLPTQGDPVAPAKRHWLFGGLARRSTTGEAHGQHTADATVAEETVQVAALTADPSNVPTQTDTVAPDKQRWLFQERTNRPTAGMALQDVGLNAGLPFGEIARVCDVPMDALGTEVEQENPSSAGYTLYDSAPDSATPRAFYVTGFSDSCARQFTATLAIFGSPQFHEQLRYGLPAEEYPYSTTDRAYEKVKAKLCNVGRNTPCGSRISRLEETTIFISAYEHFEENARWADMLLHDGALLAKSVKTP